MAPVMCVGGDCRAVLIAVLFGKILLLLFFFFLLRWRLRLPRDCVEGESKRDVRQQGQRTLSIGKCCKVRGTETVDLNQRQSMPRQSRKSNNVANLFV